MFFLVNRIIAQLEEFIKEINNCYPTIKFYLKYPKASCEFLDKTVSKNKEHKQSIHKQRTK